MKKSFVILFLSSAVTLGLVLTGCGSSSDSTSTSNPAPQTVSGIAASGVPVVAGTVSLKDSSAPALVRTTTTAGDGSFSLDVSGLTPPFMLKAEWTANAITYQMYSFADGPGTANINPFSTAAVAGAATGTDPAALYTSPDPTVFQTIAANLPAVIDSLKTKLMPLFQLYGTAQNPVTDQFVADHTGLDAMFDNVQISLSSGNIVVQNKLTSSVIFSAPAANIPAGSFNEGNMPTPTPTPTPTPIDGAALYTNNCSGCHGALATSSKRGTTAAAIQSAITSNRGGMGSLSNLTSAEIQAIATALAPTPTPTPTPTPLPGKVVYDNNCSGCHRLGTYDTAGSAPNLAGSGSKVSSKFTAGVSGHKSITLSATQITDVMQFLDAN